MRAQPEAWSRLEGHVLSLTLACRQAAEAGDAEAQAQMGHMYASGLGVPVNNQTAIKWFRQGSQGGSASAKFALGFMYLQGHSLPQDYRIALKYLNAAAEQVCRPCFNASTISLPDEAPSAKPQGSCTCTTEPYGLPSIPR